MKKYITSALSIVLLIAFTSCRKESKTSSEEYDNEAMDEKYQSSEYTHIKSFCGANE